MKTSYYQKFKTTPGGICISTYPPKWIKGKIPEYLALSPQFNFRVPFDEYKQKFEAQLAKLDPQKVWDDLHQLSGGHEPVLLCYEAPPFDKWNFCHRRMVAEWLQEKLGVDVPEWTEPETQELF